jgi:hypothetical protein
MENNRGVTFLRQVLVADGVISGLTGVLMAAAASPLEAWLGLPSLLLRVAGLSLLPFAAVVIALGRREVPPRRIVGAVVAVNASWVVASVLLLFSERIEPSALGYVFVLGQAAAVAALTELQWVGLRKSALATT